LADIWSALELHSTYQYDDQREYENPVEGDDNHAQTDHSLFTERAYLQARVRPYSQELIRVVKA
jgi:hypothetical protein